MAIVIFFAAYAISSVSRYILGPLIGQWPLYTNAVIYTGILVVSLTMDCPQPIISHYIGKSPQSYL
jgi:antibiotic biosynthesis monooxygenase (ABM) superfamily enzyme